MHASPAAHPFRRCALISVALTIAAVHVACSMASGTRLPEAVMARPTTAAPAISHVGDVPLVVLEGDAESIGKTHGELLGTSIRELHAAYFEKWFTSDLQRTFALGLAASFEQKLEPAHLRELKATAQAARIDERQLMLASCFLDLSPLAACSSITLPAGASPDGVARFGRNLDFPGFNIADRFATILVFKPQGRYAFAAVTWPGLIGVLSGMNEHGLCLANMEVDRPAGDLPAALPYVMLYRTVLERCRTVDEAIALLDSLPRQTANNLMLMDAAGHRAVVEITREKNVVRRAGDAEALISTNDQRGPGPEKAGICDRYDRLRRDSSHAWGAIDAPALQQMMHSVASDRFTLQSMIFEPQTRVLRLRTSADAGQYHTIDLKPFFAR